jgi:hypothetical protein
VCFLEKRKFLNVYYKKLNTNNLIRTTVAT